MSKKGFLVMLYTERSLNTYNLLKNKANWRERRVMSFFESKLFRETEEVTSDTLPFVVRVEYLNTVAEEVANKTKLIDKTIQGYEQLGCVYGENNDFEVIPCRAQNTSTGTEK